MQCTPGRFGVVVLLALATSGTTVSAETKLPQDKLVRFAGEVARGHEFRRPIGHGLVAAGRRQVVDRSKISPAARDIESVNYGSIDWIRFHVEIRFP